MLLSNCNVSSFIGNTGKNKIICFGASNSTAKGIVEQFTNEDINNKLLFFVDNDPKKWGTKIKINECYYDIYSPDILKNKYFDNICIFITSRFWDEIYQQLDHLEYLRDVKCYVYFLFPFVDTVKQKLIVKTKDVQVIPKTIHYCWFGGNELPKDALSCINSWKHYAPDYDIILWNESNYDVRQNYFLRRAYDQKLWACISDYARLEIVYKYGGIYFDTDVELVQSFDDLLYNNSFWGMDVGGQSVNPGVGFGAVKNNKLVYEHLMEYQKFSEQNVELRYSDGTWNLDILIPWVSTKLFLKHGLQLKDETQVLRDAVIYSSEVMSPTLQIPTINTHSLHKCSSTWSFNNGNMQMKWDKQKEFYNFLIKKGKIKFE